MAVEQIIRLNIDVTKINKRMLYQGRKGTYLDVALLMRSAEADQYGNHYMAIQEATKEQREQGEKGPIIGNAKIVKGPHPLQNGDYQNDPFNESGGGEMDDDYLPF